MAQYNYSMQAPESMAKAVLRDVPISPKSSIEIANHLRGRQTTRAKKILEASISLEKAIPFKRFTNGPGHKKGNDITSGRYAVKACTFFLALIKNVEANAQSKGLDAKHLVIEHLSVQRASEPWRYGRQTRRKTKRSHVEIVVKESKDNKETKEKETKTEKPAKQPKVKT